MHEPTPNLPPQLAHWLASRDPALVARAHAALQAAEPDTNALLSAQIERARSGLMFCFIMCLCAGQIPFQVITRSFQTPTFSRLCLALLFAVPLLYGAIRGLFLPAAQRFNALVLAFARRGDLRAVPLLLPLWLPRSVKQTSEQPDIENAMLRLLQAAPVGEVPFVRNNLKTKDPAANLRLKFDALTRKRKGTVDFAPTATITPRRVQLWLTLLPHLAADTNPKSRATLQRIADARAQTLQEELIQNDARALLAETTPPAAKTEAALLPTQAAPAWKQADADETPAHVQRAGR